MAPQAIRSLLNYISQALKEGRHDDAITGLTTLRQNVDSKEQKKRIDQDIARIMQKDKELEDAFFKELEKLEPSIP